MSKVAKKPIVVLATWPEQPGARYFGHSEYGGYVDGCDSIWLSLRSAMPGDDCYYMDDSARAMSDIGLYVWFDECGNTHNYFAIHETHNMKLSEAELRVKILRKLDKKIQQVGRRTADSFRPMLMDIFNAIGVTKAIEYRHMVSIKDSTFIPVYDAVEVIAKELDRRYAIIKKQT